MTSNVTRSYEGMSKLLFLGLCAIFTASVFKTEYT